MTAKEERNLVIEVLRQNRYADCPAEVNKRRFVAIRASLEKKYMAEFMNSVAGLYTNEEIWQSVVK